MATFHDRIDRIRKEIPIAQVLFDYGYNVRPDGGLREQQFACDLHGDGQDSKPSARVYPDTNSFYCFACGVIRSALDLVQIKEDISFMQAVRLLETRYDLPDLPWDDEETPQTITVPKKTLQTELKALLDPDRTFDQDLDVLVSALNWTTTERVLTMRQATQFWELIDQVNYKVSEKMLPEEKGRLVLVELQRRLDNLLEKKP